MQVRSVLKQVTELAGGEAVATVQLTGLGNYETFHDGYAVSHAIDRSLLVAGADIVVEVADRHRPGDGQVISVAGISTGSSVGSMEQFGSILVTTDGSGNGSAAVTFPNTFGSFASAPAVSLSAGATSLGAGSLTAVATTTSGFTINVAGASAISSVIAVAWDAQL